MILWPDHADSFNAADENRQRSLPLCQTASSLFQVSKLSENSPECRDERRQKSNPVAQAPFCSSKMNCGICRNRVGSNKIIIVLVEDLFCATLSGTFAVDDEHVTVNARRGRIGVRVRC